MKVETKTQLEQRLKNDAKQRIKDRLAPHFQHHSFASILYIKLIDIQNRH